MGAHEPEALGEGISPEIIEVVKHRKDTNGLAEADAIVIELGREIFGARMVASATFARALGQFGRRALVDLVALMGIMPGQQRSSPPSTCSSIEVSRCPCRPLTQSDVMRIRLYVPQDAVIGVKPGIDAVVRVPEIPDHSFPGKVARIANALDRKSGSRWTRR